MFAQRLKQLRKGMGLTQIQLAQEFRVSNGAVGMWETGKREPDFATIHRLAEFFHVSADYLLGGGSEPMSSPDDRPGKPNARPEDEKALTEKDRRDIARDLECIMNALENAGDLQFDGAPMSDEARESIRAAMKLGLEAAKVKNAVWRR